MADDDAAIRAQLAGLRALTPDPAANQAVIARRVQRRRRNRRVVAAGVPLTALVLFAGLLAAMRGSDEGVTVESNKGVTTADVGTSTSADGAASTSTTVVVGAADESSMVVEPDRSLAHGEAVHVRGSGAAPGEVLVRQCVGTAPPDDVVSGCGPASAASMEATADGTFAGTVVARRWLGGPAEFTDCAEQVCSLFAFVDGDTTALQAVPLSFLAGYEAPPRPSLSVHPSSALVDRQVVAVSGEGLPPR